jgi:hypothetical protein
VSDSDCGILIQKKFRYRKTDDIASTNHHCPLSLYIHTCSLQHLDDTFRCTWKDAVLLLPEGCDIQWMETVNILLLSDSSNDLVFADMFRKRKLHKDSVYRIICIEFFDKAEKLCL